MKLSQDNAKQLAKITESLVGSDDKSLSNTAREVLKICKS